jgi:hypothetical protein
MSNDQPLENVGYFQDDLIIAFKTKPISKSKSILPTAKCRIFIKEPDGYRQIGLAQDLNIVARAKDAMANVSISFPKATSKFKNCVDNSTGKKTSISSIIAKNKKDLSDLGVVIK